MSSSQQTKTTNGTASIWITSGKYMGDRLFDSDGKMASPVRWNGQDKHRADYLVTDGKHDVHVFYREKNTEAFKYIGVKHGDVHCIEDGDVERKIPAVYEFTILTEGIELLLPSGTLCAAGLITPGYCKWKSAAMEAAGLVGGNKVSGIIKHK